MYPVIDGERLNLWGRRVCLDCRPLRRQRRPRKRAQRWIATKICKACGVPFALRQVIDGKLRHLYNRTFCLACSPLGAHNTSKNAPPSDPETRRSRRRKRRAESFLRYQRKRRRTRKLVLIKARGSDCEDCGYCGCMAALEFHHRDPRTKEFGVGGFNGSTQRLQLEAAKCDLLCANCHRLRHALDESTEAATVRLRRERKALAVRYMGGRCEGCGRSGPDHLFEFHHRDPHEKTFGISESGVVRRWEKVVAELAKCVMLCANCHREVHAGVRELDEGLLGLAETAGAYAA